tara:strand:- start:49 stop:840 length:792 start_codon:yes stop_codon:yes gene_type:complete
MENENNIEGLLGAFNKYPDKKEYSSELGVISGQIRTVKKRTSRGDLTREVLIVEVHEDEDFCEVMLVHYDSDIRTDKDLIVSFETGLVSSDLVVQTDCLSVVKTWELGGISADLNDDAFDALNRVWQKKYPNIEGFHQGLPMVDRSDFRWDFKAKQGETIAFLAADCLVDLLELSDHPYKIQNDDFEDASQDGLSEADHIDQLLKALAKFEDEKVTVNPELKLGAEFKKACAAIGHNAEDLLTPSLTQKNDRIMGKENLLVAA